MLAITTRSNELNKTKPTTQLGFSLKLLSRAHNNPGQSAETGWIKKQRHQQGLIVHLQVSQDATCRANLIREVAFADADKVFINRLPSLKDAVVTMFSFN